MIKKIIKGTILFILMSLCVVCKADALITPDLSGGHPFVFLSDEFVEGLKNANGEVKPAYSVSYTYILKAANKDLPAQPAGGYLSEAISDQIMARALMYALGEVDYNHARETIEFTLEYIKNPLTSKTASIEMYKDYGEHAIQTGALVYDWCYDALKEDEKTKLYEYVMALYVKKQDTNGDGKVEYVQPCRVDNISEWNDVAGKSVGQPVMYNAIAATAFYDIDPDFYNTFMSKIQGGMADIVKDYGSVGALSDGSVQYGRFMYTYYVYVLFQRMGADDAELLNLYGDQRAFGYKMIYARTPWGANIRMGDGYTAANYGINRFTAGTEVSSAGILANIYGDEYLRHFYFKSNYSAGSLYKFLTMDCETGVKLPDTLPLAFKTTAPRTEIIARTSWKDGVNSPAVYAYMNMNERRTGDHDHANIGNFQLHYKGPLTMPSGSYVGAGWGGTHWSNYYSRTIASNCITVYDPDETFKFGSKYWWTGPNGERIPLANDGGQKMAGNKAGGYVVGEYNEHFSDDNLWAVTEGIFAGPNEKTPAFSYLKGDITKAYSENKMESYKRSMVFMDTYNETYPGVMIVYDRVVSKKAEFYKKWLLQAVSKPQISGNKITITNTKDGANGKLVNTVLLPENPDITEVGGILEYVVDGVEYPADSDFEAAEAYKSGYRVEVSPKSENKEDVFLNAMFVTDADGNAADLPMIKEETADFIGVTTLDRTVLFSKSGGEISKSFEVDLRNNNQNGKMLCFIGDLKSGKWKISGGSVNIILETNDEENCIVFSALPGKYTITPVASGQVTELLWEEEPKAGQGDFVIRKDTGYIAIADENILIDGVPYISAKTAENLGVSTTESGNTLKIFNGATTAEVTVGKSEYTLIGCKMDMKNPAVIRNGKIYIPVLEMQAALGITAEYIPDALLLRTASATKISVENLIFPEKVEGVTNAALLADGIVGEKITFSDNVYPFRLIPVVYSFDGVKKINKIALDAATNLKIYHSLDGKNYYLLNEKERVTSSGITTIKTEVYAKYIKFEAIKKLSLSEVSVYGSDFVEKCAFASGNIKSVLKNEPLKVQAYIEDGFNTAKFYIGDIKVCDIEEKAGNIYNLIVPLDILEQISDEECVLKIAAEYSGTEYSAEEQIKLIKCADKITIINESFDGGSSGKVFGTRSGYTFSRNKLEFQESFENNKFAFIFDKQYTSSGPYITAANFKYGKGYYDICFDADISSQNVLIVFELRNKDNKNINNVTYPLVSNVGGNNKFIIRADTVNHILRVFVKNIDTNEDYILLKEIEFPNESLGQIRFNVSSRDDSATVSFDNYHVDFYPFGISVFSPENGQTFENGNVKLSASCPGADEVYFYINNEEVRKFTSPLNGLCEYEAAFANGVKNFDIYCKRGNNIYTQSYTFVCGSTVVSDVKYNGKSIKTNLGYALNDNAKSIEILLHSQDVSVKSVKFGGKEISFSSSLENNVLTLSGLNLKGTGILEIVLDGNETESVPVYVTDNNGLVIVPVMLYKEDIDVLVFANIKNFGDTSINYKLILAEYDEDNSLSQIKFFGKQLLSGDENILSGQFKLKSSTSKYEVMILDENLCSLADILD